MNTLLLGLLLFLGMHSARIVAEQGRLALQARIGATAFKGLYAVVSLLGFYLVLKGYGEARLDPVAVWAPPKGMRHLAVLLMLPAMVLLVAAYIPRNALKNRLQHPMVLSVKVWALAHLSSNGMWPTWCCSAVFWSGPSCAFALPESATAPQKMS